MKARITLIARVLLTAALLGFAFLFISLQKTGQGPSSIPADQVSGKTARIRPTKTLAERPMRASECQPDLLVPVAGMGPDDLTDTFTDARSDGRRHDAIDILAPVGRPVMAAAHGMVEKLFYSNAGGNTVYVRSPDRKILYYYAHLDRYAADLREGDQVRTGDRIGYVGFTGNANPATPHLHFAIISIAPSRKWFDAGIALNPFSYLTQAQSIAATCPDAGRNQRASITGKPRAGFSQ